MIKLTIITSIIYLIGVVLCYMRVTASHYEENESWLFGEYNLQKHNNLLYEEFEKEIFYIISLSWVMFLVGWYAYSQLNEKYFFKLSFNGLRRKLKEKASES